jgi:epoxyqueuosine reductase
MSLTQDIKRKIIAMGFDLAGITDASPIDAEQVEFFAAWLNSGFAGQMDYMHRNLHKRFNPSSILEDAQSVIVTGLNFTTPTQKKQIHTTTPMGRIVDYAQYQDYHPFIEKQLYELTDFISSMAGRNLKYKICVDSAPLAERALAVRAGLGFIGKNHMLINPKFGCRIFLGEIITNLKLETDTPIVTDCSNCHKCIDVCPTSALRADGQLDASRCINYLTIEHKGRIPLDLAEKIDVRLFGCNECINICPYQKNAPACNNKQFRFYNDRAAIDLREVLDLNQESFETKFSDSVIIRSGLDRLKRNAENCFMNITQNKNPHKKTT